MKKLITAVSAFLTSLMAVAQVATVNNAIEEFEYTGQNSASYRVSLEVEIHNRNGSDLASFYHPMDADHTLKRFSAVMTDAKGKETKVKKGELGRTEYSESLASEAYALYYTLHPVQYPVTVKFDYEIEYRNGISSIPSFTALPCYDVDVKKASYRIIYADDNQWRYHAFNFEPDIKRYDVKNKHVAEVTVENLPAMKRYSDGLSFEERVQHIYFAPTSCKMKETVCDMSSWLTYGDWCYSLTKGRDVLPPALIEKVKAMTDTCSSTLSKIQTVRTFVGATTHYMQVNLGLGGFQPMLASEVAKKGVGDCKALSNYFCTLLRAIGIEAYYTLISTDDEDLIDDLPSFTQINHVIACVPMEGDTLWVECTNPKYKVDNIPTNYFNHEVLVLKEGGSELHTIRKPEHIANRQTEVFDLLLMPDGSAVLDIDCVNEGFYFERQLGLESLRADEQRKQMGTEYYMPHQEVKQLTLNSSNYPATLHLSANSKGWASKSGSRLFVPITPNQFGNMRNALEQPHVVKCIDQEVCDTVRLHLPEGYVIESLPDNYSIANDFGSISLVIKAQGDVVEVVITLAINKGTYPAEKFNDWVAFRKQLAEITQKKLVIRKE